MHTTSSSFPIRWKPARRSAAGAIRTAAASLACSLLLTGCTFNFWYKDFITPSAQLEPPPLHLLSIGMSKQDVTAALGDPEQVVAMKEVEGELIETWEYVRIEALPGPDRLAERYEVFFTDGLLSGYESTGDSKRQINLR